MKEKNGSNLGLRKELDLQPLPKNSPASKRKFHYMDHIINKKAVSRGDATFNWTQDKITITQESTIGLDRDPTMTMLPTTPNSGGLKNFSMESELFKHE